jgi:capsular polysaccharide biosynthesis protein
MSRQGSHRRKIKNFDAVKSILNKYDFDIYRPENLSIIEEAGVFSQANIIVGVAGSNIAGIVFSSDATLIELLPHDEPMPVYYTLANEMRLQYAHIFGKPIGQEDMNQHRDVYIDIDHLSNMIQEIDRRVTDR